MSEKLSSFRHSYDAEEVIPETEFIGGIFPRKQITVIASQPGVGKTWYMLQTCADLSRGGVIFGGKSFDEEPRKCLIFCGENGYELVLERIKAMKTQPYGENFVIYSSVEMARANISLMLNDKDGWENVCAIVKQENPDVIFFDTLISFNGGDENVAKEMSPVFSRLRHMAEVYNAAIVLIHHVRKQKKSDAGKRVVLDDVIGSSAILRLASLVITISPQGSIVKIVECKKTWYKRWPSWAFSIRESSPAGYIELKPDYGWDGNFEGIRTKVRKYIMGLPNGTIITTSIISDKLGTDRNITSAEVARLAKKGILRKVETTTPNKAYEVNNESAQLTITVDDGGNGDHMETSTITRLDANI